MPTPFRTAVEQRSIPAIAWLQLRPTWLLPVVLGLLLVGSGLLPVSGAAICALALVLVVAWLGYLSWPLADPRGRVVRVIGAVLVAVPFALNATG
jgi:hypothetical protein